MRVVNPVITPRIIRDTLCIKGPMSKIELCNYLSVDHKSVGNDVMIALLNLVDQEQVLYDIKAGVYTANYVLR